MRGAWIEIIAPEEFYCLSRSLPLRGAWIEISFARSSLDSCSPSLPMRGAWIEIMCRKRQGMLLKVAPPAGSVDLKYVEAVKLPSQGMYRDGKWRIFGVIPYLTAIDGRYAVQYSRKRDD